MSGRPRLVEEGTPIYQDMNDDGKSGNEASTSIQHQHFMRHRETSPPRQKKISTHIVIGGRPQRTKQDHFSSGAEHGDDIMMTDEGGHAGGSSLSYAAFGTGNLTTGSHSRPKKGRTQTHFVVGSGESPSHHHAGGVEMNSAGETDHAHMAPRSVQMTEVEHHHFQQPQQTATFHRKHNQFSHEHTHHHASVPITIGSGFQQPSVSQEHQHHFSHDQADQTPFGAHLQPPRPHHERLHHFSHDHTQRHTSRPITIGNHKPHYFYHEAQPPQTLSNNLPTQTSMHLQNSGEAEARMELDDIIPKDPLIVIDGANIAYAYADANSGLDAGSTALSNSTGRNYGREKTEPDARGISVAARYFLSAGCRVQVVIPTGWMRAKPRLGDTNRDNSLMMTPQVETLKELRERNLVCTAPPADDDDAYAIAIARREDTRARRRGGEGGGFVLSNDFFRDAIRRDDENGSTTSLRKWLENGSGQGPGRISYSFVNMDSADVYGDHELDFMPNPRHTLIERIEHEHRARELQHA